MKNIVFLSIVLLWIAGGNMALAQDMGQRRSYDFLRNDFVKIFNDWSDASVEKADETPDNRKDRERRLVLVRNNVMSIMDYHNIAQSDKINNMVAEDNGLGNGWMGFFERQVSEGMPFQIKIRRADFVGMENGTFWFLVRYAIRYIDRCDFSYKCRYNPLDTIHYVCRNIEVEDYMCVRNDFAMGCMIHQIQSQKPDDLVAPTGPVDESDLQINTFTELVCGVRFKMVLVENGDGCNYYIGETEVTQQLWDSVMGPGNNPSNFRGWNLPVENISWAQAQKFVAKLNEITGRNYRLPTEKEWSFAAGGGLKGHGYAYSGSDICGDVAWYSRNAPKTFPVASKRPNELDIYDMSGNVWEWCADSYLGTHVTMGGGYNSPDCKISQHVKRDETHHSSNVGMRLVL